MLKTNIDKGIGGDDVELHSRRDTFGANTYPRKKRRSFWVCLAQKMSCLNNLGYSKISSLWVFRFIGIML